MNLDLFDTPLQSTNLLPYDGEVHYHGVVLSTAQADSYFQTLFDTIAWKQDEAVIMGKTLLTKRKVAWYADQPFQYTYSKKTKTALPWLPVLQELKHLVQAHSGESYNACLLNLYHTGDEGMAWHSDAERDLKKNGAIASLSLGAQRKFSFKHKRSAETLSIVLEHGSLLVMKGSTQSHWLHRLPPTRTVQQSRISLTFRTIQASSVTQQD